MNFHWQDLKKDENSTRHWLYGRCWFRRTYTRPSPLFNELRVCWVIPDKTGGISLAFGGEDNGITVTLWIPFLLSLYITLSPIARTRMFPYDFDRGEDREIGLRFHDNAIWWSIWVGTMASWSRRFPWCRWWRQGSFHFATLLGPQKYICEILNENIPCLIHMPEGDYPGMAKIERRTWKRPLWFMREQTTTYIEVEHGIPFQGKGENSWDCGDDGLFGAGVQGTDIVAAVNHFRDVVMTNRRKYGEPSPKAIAEALP